jgi:hypothetical protein
MTLLILFLLFTYFYFSFCRLAKAGLFKGIPGKLLRALGGMPVKRKMDVVQSLDKVLNKCMGNL